MPSTSRIDTLLKYTMLDIIYCIIFPICSMYSIFTYIWVIYGGNVGKYSIHGAHGLYIYIYKNIMVKKILRPHYIDDGQYW